MVARRLPRAQRREQILAAATSAFVTGGYAATGLDDVAAAAGITHVILYRHFTSKSELYRAVLERARDHLAATVGAGEYDEGSVPKLLRAAATDPDGFRLLFRHAAREPEFRDIVDRIRDAGVEIAHCYVDTAIADPAWREWAARLIPTVAQEAVIAWLDAGQPDPEQAGARVVAAIAGVVQAARPG